MRKVHGPFGQGDLKKNPQFLRTKKVTFFFFHDAFRLNIIKKNNNRLTEEEKKKNRIGLKIHLN